MRVGLFALVLIAAAEPALASSAAVDEYLLAITHELPPVAKEVLQRVGDRPRQLLAARGYIRADRQLTSRWSWTAEEIRAYEASAGYRELLAAIDAVRTRFEFFETGVDAAHLPSPLGASLPMVVDGATCFMRVPPSVRGR